MAKKMLIDATHAEETRVVVVDGNKVEEFDFESENKRQLAGNIYLAKVTRVEPSLQAAFVDYGGNRHGFLAFSEIHPDYYQIPVADREALMEEERAYAEAQKARDEEEDTPKPKRRSRSRSRSKAAAETKTDATDAPAEAKADADQIEGMETIDLTEADAPADVVETAEASPVEAPTETPAEDTAPEVEVAEASEEAPAETTEETVAEASDDQADDEDGKGKPGQTMAANSDADKDDAVATQDPETGAETEADAAPAEPVEATEDTPEEAPAEEPAAETAEATEETTEEKTEAKSEETKSEGESSEEDSSEDKAEEKSEKPRRNRRKRSRASDKDDSIESVADDDDNDDIRPARKPRPRRYKIQEVIKVRQIMLVQVVKEERGNKGAALTTYLSLAGRYCVLMPNTARGGGISRKITNVADRKKLKEIATEIDVPQGAGLIIRTAGAKRTKSEIKRDYEYLQRMWEQIRELTLKSSAPAKIYEEGDLIKRSIRDLYNREIDEVLVEGERGYRIAKDFMKMIMPSHAKNVKNYHDQLPLFARYQVESYLAGMFNPTVQLKSGGYIVIGVTEALVAVDVNSGRATKEGSIEETALKTNLEAAEEVARQLRLRDLAGLIVIDFIDMDERKNNAAVEKRMKDKLKTDRARIQVGRISGFGLMEMSRQRLRPGMIEATTQPCPHCHGTGLVRSDDNLALNILRQIEEEGTRGRSREVLVKAPISITNYLMNQKREHIAMIESRYGMSVRIEGDPTLISPDFTLEKLKTATRSVPEAAPVVSVDSSLMDQIDEDIEDAEVVAETPEGEEEAQPKKRRRRRRRRKGRGENGDEAAAPVDGEAAETSTDSDATEAPAEGETPEAAPEDSEEKPKRRRRSRSRKKKTDDAEAAPAEAATEEAPADAEAPVEAEAAPEAAPAEEPAEKPKPKRTRAKAKPKAEKAVEAPAEADVAVAEPAAETPAEPAPEPTPEPVVAAAEPAPEAVAEAAPEPAAEPKPKRRGWWSMKS